MPRGKAAGIARERRLLAWYRERGWIAFRTPASLGVCDVVALKGKLTNHGTTLAHPEPQLYALAHFIEVKSTSGGPYEHFRKEQREALKKAAAKAGAQALLAHWPPRGKLRFIASSDWP